MSVLNGKVVKTKSKLRQQGKNVKNTKNGENQKNKQSPTIAKAVKGQKFEKGVSNNQCNENRESKNSPSVTTVTKDPKIKNVVREERIFDSAAFNKIFERKSTSNQQKPTSANKESAAIVSKNKSFAASDKSEAPQSQYLQGITKQKNTGIKGFGKKTSSLKTAERNESHKNMIKDQYNQKLQNKVRDAERNKTKRSFMERNSKENVTKSFQKKDNSESGVELEKEDEVMESDIAEDEQMVSDNAEDEIEMNSDDEEIESDSECEEIGSDAKYEEIESDAEDEEIESDAEYGEMESGDEEIESDVEDEESNTRDQEEMERDSAEDSDGNKANEIEGISADDANTKSAKNEEDIGQCRIRNTVCVSNLNVCLDEKTIRKHFEIAGEVRSIKLMPGIGLVEMSNSIGFQTALSLNHTLLLGHRIKVYPSQMKEMLRCNKEIDANDKNTKEEGIIGQLGINTVYVGNLNAYLDEGTVRKYFEKAGEVSNLHLYLHTYRGYGFVEMSDSKGYERALSLHNTMLFGRRINVRQYKKKGILGRTEENLLAKVEGKEDIKEIEKKGNSNQGQTGNFLDGPKYNKLFVNHLHQKLDEQAFQKYFEKAGEVRNIKLVHYLKPGKLGHGYVEMSDNKSYEKALSLHDTILLGERIEVKPMEGIRKRSGRRISEQPRKASSCNNCCPKYVKDRSVAGIKHKFSANRNTGHRIFKQPSQTWRCDHYCANHVRGPSVAGFNHKFSTNRNTGHHIFERPMQTWRCDHYHANHARGTPVAGIRHKYNRTINMNKGRDTPRGRVPERKSNFKKSSLRANLQTNEKYPTRTASLYDALYVENMF